MIEQAAKVVASDGRRALVEVARQATCGGCPRHGGCATSVLGDWFLRRRRRFYVEGGPDVAVGDEVILGIEEGVLQRVAALAFLLPLIGLLLAAVVGRSIAGAFDGSLAEPVAIVAGLVGLIAGIRLVRILIERGYRAESATPIVLRTRTPQPVTAVESLHS